MSSADYCDPRYPTIDQPESTQSRYRATYFRRSGKVRNIQNVSGAGEYTYLKKTHYVSIITRFYCLKQPPKPTDLCTVCYTSGTTGLPKGVMLTHGNVVAAVSAILVQLSQYRPNVGDVMISYLPLAHMLERCCEVNKYETNRF